MACSSGGGGRRLGNLGDEISNNGEDGKNLYPHFLQPLLENIDRRSCNDGNQELIPVFNNPLETRTGENQSRFYIISTIRLSPAENTRCSNPFQFQEDSDADEKWSASLRISKYYIHQRVSFHKV